MLDMVPFTSFRVTLTTKKKGTRSGPLYRLGFPERADHSESSSIRAMSAPSPGRWPILRMRV